MTFQLFMILISVLFRLNGAESNVTSTEDALEDIEHLATSMGVETSVSILTSSTTTTPSTSDYVWTTTTEGDGRFCNKSLSYTVKTECKPCALNAVTSCPDGLTQITQGRGVSDCTYGQPLLADVIIYVAGCRHSCMKDMTISMCCPGYWGVECAECPGGSEVPCSGHGRCADGLNGNGSCTCQTGFVGFACEECQPGYFGSDCNSECKCRYGNCSDGVNGNGSCTCDSGYTGLTCEQPLLNCSTYSCPNNSRCVESTETKSGVTCVCNFGYGADVDGICRPINRCTGVQRPCDRNALCIPTGPGLFECSCMFGYEGDGLVCSPVNPCQTDAGGCPLDSTKCVYSGPGQRQCRCLDGYQNYTESEGCQLVDVCLTNRTLCHAHATCTVTAPWEVECVCEQGYVGDGQNCYSNLLERLSTLNSEHATLRGQFRYATQLTSSLYSETFTRHGPFTWFLATDAGFEKSLSRRELQLLFSDAEAARQLLRQHLIASQLTLADLTNVTHFYMLEGTTADLSYKNRELRFRLHDFNLRANVIQGDIIASNGVIHIIDQLMDKPPVVVGNFKKSIEAILAAETQYATFYSLLRTAGLLEQLSPAGHFTVFAPNNDAWSELPQGTVNYFTSDEGRGKLIALLKNHIIEGPYVLAEDLINVPRFVSMGGSGNAVAVTQWGRITLNGVVNVTQSNIPASNGYIHRVDGVLTSDSLLPLLPHRCDVATQRTVRGTCGMCSGELKCPLPSDIALNETGSDCRYWMNIGVGGRQNYVASDGCYRLCNRTYTILQCCDGFYSESCHPCPGGFQNPCHGRGNCNDGFHGTGECACATLYTGAECEFCKDANSFGVNCSSKCSCLHGVCDNRVVGSIGRCKPYTCQAGYSGVNCDLQLQRCDKRLRIRCHAFADCIRQDPQELLSRVAGEAADDTEEIVSVPARMRVKLLRKVLTARSTCQCRQGYQGPGTHCEEINPCLEPSRGGCHLQAECIKTGPGLATCICSDGWVGDGVYCYPSSPCLNHTECHENAICVPSTPNQYVCSCLDGYHGNGTYCVLDNVCNENNGGCHENADCQPLGPGRANCTCFDGFGGDGISCYGTISLELITFPQLTSLNKLLQLIPRENYFLDDTSKNYTLFAPTNEAVDMMLNTTSSEFWEDDGNILQFLSFHLVQDSLSLEDLRSRCHGQPLTTMSDDDDSSSLHCTQTSDQVIYVNDAMVTGGSYRALNGFIYVVNKVLEPRSAMVAIERLEPTMSRYSQFEQFFSSLVNAGIVSEIDRMEEYTLLVPLSQQLAVSASRRYMSYFVIPRTLTMFRLKAMNGQTVNSLLGDGIQQQFEITVQGDTVFVNQLAIVEPNNLRTLNGVIHALNGSLNPVINRCDKMSQDQKLIDQCCRGYYGIDCVECPGGADASCSNNGQCHDGIEGTGVCNCWPRFTGSSCETCIAGDCSNNRCHFNNGGCHSTADCQYDKSTDVVKCTCSDGYTMIEAVCEYTDNDCAVANGGCSKHALCFQNVSYDNSTNEITCRCRDDYVGDGRVCNGNLLLLLSETPETSQFYQLILSGSKSKPDEWTRSLSLLNGSSLSNVTLFVPVNCTGLLELTADDLEEYIVVGGKSALYENVVENKFDNGSLDITTVNNKKLVVYINKIRGSVVNNVSVVKRNIEATNGIVYILDRPFHEKFMTSSSFSASKESSAKQAGSASLVLGICFVVLAAMVLVLATVRYRRELTRYIRDAGLLESVMSLVRRQFAFRQFDERDVIWINDAGVRKAESDEDTDENGITQQLGELQPPFSRDDSCD